MNAYMNTVLNNQECYCLSDPFFGLKYLRTRTPAGQVSGAMNMSIADFMSCDLRPMYTAKNNQQNRLKLMLKTIH